MLTLSKLANQSRFLLFELPLYTEITISKELEEKSEQELISNDEEWGPSYINFDIWNESYDLFLLREMIYHDFNIYGYCPCCDKELMIKRTNLRMSGSDKKRDRELLREANIHESEQYESCKEYANHLQEQREIKFVEECLDASRNFFIEMQCTAPDEHKFIICFHYTPNGKLLKFGQNPSIVDFQKHLSYYKKYLKKEDVKELSRAIGLKAHGIGIGSFVYLRRIFEKIIYEKYKEMPEESKLLDVDFNKKRMNEKIVYLKEHLPEFLVRNSSLYGILSKGIHELSDKECLQYFDIVNNAITLILKEEAEMQDEYFVAAEPPIRCPLSHRHAVN